jgi:hypothetical protein
MTAQEQQMLQGLADRINQTKLAEKDTDAEALIQQTLGQNPDAMYVMAQTVLVQEYALNQAQKLNADLKAQLAQAQQPRHATSFLGSLLGRHDEPQPAAPAPAPPPPPMPPQYAGAGVGPGLAYPSGGYPIPNAPAPQGGGFLRSAMQTATGVAAGALAFEGIESLMHGFGHAAGYGSEFGGPGFGAAGYEGAGFGGAPREEIVNNYYGDAKPEEHGRDASYDTQNYGTDGSTDRISDRPADGGDGRFQDASYVTDQQSGADTNADDLSGTAGSDYSEQGDDSMLSDDVGGDAGSDGGGFDSGGDDSGGDFGGGDGGDGGGGF